MADVPTSSSESDLINLSEYIRVVWKRKFVVIVIVGVAIVGTFIYCMVTPKIYESTTTIIAPKESPMGGLGGGLLGSALAQSMPGLPLSGVTPNRDLFLSILRSRTMARDVVEKFELRERWGLEYWRWAVDALRLLTLIKMTDEGTISISIKETDPQLASDIANFYVANLNKRLTTFETTEAGGQRKFVEGRLVTTAADLKGAEEALKRFQEKHKTFALQDQARGLVEEMARLKGKLIAEEVYLQGMRTTSSDENPEVIRTKRRIEAMNGELEKQFGEAPFRNFPERGLELARLTRDVTIHSTVYSLLTQRLEEAKIAEARDTPKVQIIDMALPAEMKSSPKVKLSLMIAACGSFIFGIVMCFFVEFAVNLWDKGTLLARPRRGSEPPPDETGGSDGDDADAVPPATLQRGRQMTREELSSN